MARAVAEGVGRPDIRVKGMPWALLGIAGLFAETPREVHKMRYLWRAPVRLDNAKLVAFLGEEPHTPLGEAVWRTLAALKVS